MQIPNSVSNFAAGMFVPTATLFLQHTINNLIPWFFAMFSVIIADLFFGLRKSLKMHIHISISMAFRETMSKIVTYTAFVLTVCMIDEASGTSNMVAKWGCLAICVLEGISVVGNILKPYGIDLSLGAVLKIALRFMLGKFAKSETADEDAENLLHVGTTDDILQREKARWEHRQTRGEYGSTAAKDTKKKE